MIWQIQEAKNKFSEVIEKTLLEGPQAITRCGKKVVIMISVKEYENNILQKTKLGDFFLDSPLCQDLKLERGKDTTSS